MILLENIYLTVFIVSLLTKALALSFLVRVPTLRTVWLSTNTAIFLRLSVLLCLLLVSPLTFGPSSTVTYLINIQPSSTLDGVIPLEHLYSKASDYAHLRLFVCVCYVLLTPRERTKLTAQSIECIFLGYNDEHKGYRCWDPVSRWIRISRDVTFDESRPFYPRPSSSSTPASIVEPLYFLTFSSTPIRTTPIPPRSSPPVHSSSLVPFVPIEDVPPLDVEDSPSTLPFSSDSASPFSAPSSPSSPSFLDSSPFSDEPSSPVSSPRYALRNRQAFQPPGHYNVAATPLIAPNSYREAMVHEEWQHAMAEKIAAFERTGTWDLMHLPDGVRPITCKWIYTIKTHSNGSLERYKARLVALGFQQEYRRDYEETFTHVAHMTTIHTLLAAAFIRQSISQLNVKNVFLNGELWEEVYMRPPHGYLVLEGMVCRLRHSLYGLKQAPRA
ncbi:unnamed protein product [Rhodiola kirilowii]